MINADCRVGDVFCIGASAGGLQAVTDILARRPEDLPAVVAVTIHRSPEFDSRLVDLLGRKSVLPVMEPTDGAKVHWTRPAGGAPLRHRC